MKLDLHTSLKPIAIVAFAALVGACSDSTTSEAGAGFATQNPGGENSGGNTTDFDKAQLLIDLTDHVYIPAVQDFKAQTESQLAATTAYCDNLVSEQKVDADLKMAAQQSWQASMSQWQQLEMMQVGPLLENDSQLRNVIYSWPVDSQCAVDLDVSYFEQGEIAGTPYNIKNRVANRRGLDALEHLLFAPSLEHSCKSDNLGPKDWNQRPELERQIARCEFAVEVASDLNDSAIELENAWLNSSSINPSIGFSAIIKNTARDGFSDQFETIDDAINHLTDGLFYLDTITKDAKLGAPIGLKANSCGTATCIADVESNISGHSLQNVRANLAAMLDIFEGTDSANQIAFDDYLIAVDAADLVSEMREDIQATIDKIDAFEGDFQDAVVNNPAQVQALYEQTKKVTDNLKSTFIVFLSLQLPSSSAGDAD